MHHTTGAAEAHHLRRPVVVMPQQRDVLDGDEPLAPHAAFKDTSPPSAHRLHGRPPDIAATVPTLVEAAGWYGFDATGARVVSRVAARYLGT